ERRLITHSQVGQCLAIQPNLGHLETVHEATVGQPVHPRGRVDARDPQTAEVALLVAAIAIGVPVRLHHGLVGAAEQLGACSPLTLGHAENLLVTTTCYKTTFYAHFNSPRISW